MSRPYNEEWQRRKSMLVKSLFHDIPVLSPIPEESFAFDILHTHDPPDVIHRPYSPLPPLIIEREPDKHDEPEEYYKKLLKKIKKIYRRLFIENKSIDSDDFNTTGVIDDFTDNDFSNKDGTDDEMNALEVPHESVDDYNENDASDIEMNVINVTHDDVSINSHKTIDLEGYVADFESSSESVNDYSDINVKKSNDLIDSQQESEDEDMNEENDLESNTVDQYDNNVYLNNASVDKEITKQKQAEEITSESISKSQEEINEDSKTYETANTSQDDCTDNNIQSMDITGDLNKQVTDYNKVSDTSNYLENNLEINEAGLHMDLVVETRSDVKASELLTGDVVIRSEGMNVSDDEADDTFDAGIDYRQITTRALVHVDGSQQNIGRVSPEYETVTSPILPARLMISEDARGDAVLEDEGDPEKSSSLTEDFNNKSIEQMRTPRTDKSIDSNNNNHYNSNTSSHSLNTQQNAPQIENTNNLLEINNSYDINDVLSSIMNNSKETSFVNRKRKMYEDISCQTVGKVSWDEVKENFFVGPPKIFRLCRCVDHDCTS